MLVRNGANLEMDKSKLEILKLSEASSLYLDILRVLLSQCVLLGHAFSFFDLFSFLGPPSFPWIQSIAVVGFFWLSGFLICHSTLIKKIARPSYSFSEYFIERFSRIYSGFLPAILFVACVDYFFIYFFPDRYGFYGVFSVSAAFQNMLMLQHFPLDFLRSSSFGTGSTWWSLGIEWWLYMFFGWALLVVMEKPVSKFNLIVLFILTLVPFKYAVSGISTTGVGLSLIWFLGCSFSLLKDKLVEQVNHSLLLVASLIFFFLSLVRYKISMDSYDMIGSLYLGGAFLCSLCYFQTIKCKDMPKIKKLVHFLSGYSFTLFLTHYSVLYFISASGLASGCIAFVVGCIFANAAAALVAYKTELKYRSLAALLKSKLYSGA